MLDEISVLLERIRVAFDLAVLLCLLDLLRQVDLTSTALRQRRLLDCPKTLLVNDCFEELSDAARLLVLLEGADLRGLWESGEHCFGLIEIPRGGRFLAFLQEKHEAATSLGLGSGLKRLGAAQLGEPAVLLSLAAPVEGLRLLLVSTGGRCQGPSDSYGQSLLQTLHDSVLHPLRGVGDSLEATKVELVTELLQPEALNIVFHGLDLFELDVKLLLQDRLLLLESKLLR